MITELAQTAPSSVTEVTGIYGVIAAVAVAIVVQVSTHLSNRKSIKGIRNQVENSHPPDRNLRDDLDKAIAVSQQVLAQVERVNDDTRWLRGEVRDIRNDDLPGIRDEIGAEREARLALERRIEPLFDPARRYP